MIRIVFLSLILILGSTASKAEEPWSISSKNPVTTEVYAKRVEQQHKHRKKYKVMSDFVFDFFQKYISPLDGATCYYRPTCSLYTARAIMRYGVFKGCIMGADRLIRCHTGQKESRFDQPIDY